MSSTTLKLTTLNVEGLRNPAKATSVAAYCLGSNTDLLLIQETHLVTPEDWRTPRKHFKDSIIYYSPGTTRSAGTAIILKAKFKNLVQGFKIDNDGRVVSLNILVNGQRLRIINIYAPNQPADRKRFFAWSFLYLDGTWDLLFLGGDFNCVLNPALDKDNPDTYPDNSRTELQQILDDMSLYDAFRLKFPTRIHFSQKSTQAKSRLGRLYAPSNTDVELLTSDYFPVGSSHVYISDHDSLETTFRIKSKVERGHGLWRLNTLCIQEDKTGDLKKEIINILTCVTTIDE